MISIVLFMVIGVHVLVEADHEVNPSCNVSDFSLNDDDPPLPRLPDQFYYSVEATIVEFNRTIYASEFLDEIKNRGRFDFTSRGVKSSAISDYNSGEAFIFPNRWAHKACTVTNLLTTNWTAPVTRFLFGIMYDEKNNTVHIGAPSFVFYNFINTSVVKYLGKDSSRGIPSYHWQACAGNDSENSSYIIDYYFTNGSLWSNTYVEEGWIPVTVELRGIRPNRTGNNLINIEHYYTFVDYRTGPDAVPEEVFMVPTGLICSGRDPGKPLPRLPNFFSTSLEIMSSDQNYVLSFEEFYDFDHNLLRIDGSQNISGPFTVIHDFNTETQYYILPNSFTCQASPLAYQYVSFDSIVGSDGHLHQKSAQSLFYAEESRNFVYEGVTTVRGNMVDVWIAQNLTEITIQNSTYTDNVYQLYFTRSGQFISSKHGSTSDPVIWQGTFTANQTTVDKAGSTTANISSTTSYFSFSPAEPPLDAYDIQQCYSSDEYVELRIKLPLDTVPLNQPNLKQNIRAGISNYAKSVRMPFLSPLQVSSVRIRKPESGYSYAHVHIANISRNTTRQWQYSAQALLDRMLQGVGDGQPLPFTITTENVVVTPLYVSPSSEETSEETSEGLSSAAVAGVSVGTFITGMAIGIIAGLLIHFLLNRHNKNYNVGSTPTRPEGIVRYERHVDEDIADVTADNAKEQ